MLQCTCRNGCPPRAGEAADAVAPAEWASPTHSLIAARRAGHCARAYTDRPSASTRRRCVGDARRRVRRGVRSHSAPTGPLLHVRPAR
eukprot:5870428-Prymnesium_polylepis.1